MEMYSKVSRMGFNIWPFHLMCHTAPLCSNTNSSHIQHSLGSQPLWAEARKQSLFFNHQSTVSFSLCKERLDCSAPNKTCLASQVKYMTMSSVLEFALYGICLYIIFLTLDQRLKWFNASIPIICTLCPRCCCLSMVHLVSFVLVMLPFHYRFIAKKVLGVCFEKWASLIESCIQSLYIGLPVNAR